MSGRGPAVWDAGQYERFKRERAQPYHDLVARIPDGPVRYVADLGCGTAEQTLSLLERWPRAHVWGVDSSAEMLERAGGLAGSPRLELVRADLATWEPPQPLDRIVANASFQWVPDHPALFARLAGLLATGGVLAVQMPRNTGETAYRILSAILTGPRWGPRFAELSFDPPTESPGWYFERLHGLGLEPQVWETIYYHRMPSPEAIVEWIKGSALRPVLTAATPQESEAILAEFTAGVVDAYEQRPHGVLFPFRRMFLVAGKPGESA